jgi:hypothetical protein
MFNAFDLFLIRQRYEELNKRGERLYVPVNLDEQSTTARNPLAGLRQWLSHVSIGHTPRRTGAAHGTVAK